MYKNVAALRLLTKYNMRLEVQAGIFSWLASW